MIINSENIQEINNLIKKAKKENQIEKIIIKAKDEEFNRKVLELKNIDVLLSPEQSYEKDKLKQRASGLNEFLCKLAKKNKISIAIDIKYLQTLQPKDKARLISRILQNIRLCKKSKTNIILWPENEYSNLDAISFIKSLNGSTELIKK